jgi:hypothetical protein
LVLGIGNVIGIEDGPESRLEVINDDLGMREDGTILAIGSEWEGKH